jgi:putative peptidoglycan lipid II flippase
VNTIERPNANRAVTADRVVTGNARIMIAGTAASRLTGFLRLAALAYVLGGSRLSDAYNLANTTPNILYDLVIGGVLSGTLVPIFVAAVRRRPDDEDWDAVSAVTSAAAAVLVALTAALFLVVPLLVHLYTLGLHDAASVAERRLAVDLLYLFVPQVALYGAITLMTALLNARGRFAAPAFAPVLNNVVIIVSALIIHHVSPHATVDSVLHDRSVRLILGVGTTLGVLAIAVAMVPTLLVAGPRLRWRWRPRHPAIRRLVRLSGWTFGFVAANQVAFFIITVLANRHAGDLTAYTYAYWLFQLPYGVFAVSVMSALEPDLAHDWIEGNIAEYRRQLVHGIKLVSGVIMPAALGYALLARPVVRLLLEHGNFTAHNARTTSDVLALMALGLPAFSVYLLLMRAYQAMQNTRTMFLTYLVENGINIALAFALAPRFGVRGLAAAFSLAYLGGALVALRDLRRRLGGLREGRLVTSLYRITVAAALTADLALAVSNLLGHLLGTGGGLVLVARVTAAVITGVTVYVYVTRYFGVGEVASLLSLRRHSAP